MKADVYLETEQPVANGAFTYDGRFVFSSHPMYETDIRVSVTLPDGGIEPFPNLAWNTPRKGDLDWLDAVLGLRHDADGRVWLMDMGTRSRVPAKLVVWDTRADRLERIVPLPPDCLTRHSEPNDFVVDPVRNLIFIADEGAGEGGDGSTAALIVLDLSTGQATRRLEGRPGMAAEPHGLMVEGRELTRIAPDGGRQVLRVGADGIALDAAREWLYVSPLVGYGLYRVRVDDLIDPALDDEALFPKLERYCDKPNSGGIWFDAAGNLYLTEIEANAVGRVAAGSRSYERVLVRDDLFWPDGLLSGADGALYCVVSQLPRSPALAVDGQDHAERPFKVIRFQP